MEQLFVIPPTLLARWQQDIADLARRLGVRSLLFTRFGLRDIEIVVSGSAAEAPFAEGQRLPRGIHPLFCETTFANNAVTVIPDASTDPYWRASPAAQQGLVSYFGYPLRLYTGQPFGTLCIMHDVPLALTPEERAAMEALRERIEAEAAQLQRDVLATAQLDLLSAATVITDEQGRIISHNQALRRVLGIDGQVALQGVALEAVLNVREAGCLLPDEPARPHQLPQGVAHGACQLVDGRIIQWRSRMLEDADTGLWGTVWIFEDTTQLMVAREAAEHGETVFRKLFSSAAAGIVLLDTQGVVSTCNEAFASMLGLSRRRVEGTLLRDLVPDDEREHLRSLLQQLLADAGAGVRFALRCLHADGETVWADIHASGVTLATGGALQILGVVIDVTEVRRAQHELARSERRYRTLFDNAQVAIFRSRLEDGKVLEANTRMMELFGYPDMAVLLREGSTRAHYDDPVQRDRLVERLLREGEFRNMVMPMHKCDDTPLWVEYSCKLEDDTVVGVMQDVTERVRTEEALRRSEIRYRNLFDLAADGLLLYTLDGVLLDVNRVVCARVGKTREELVGKPLASIVAPEMFDRIPGIVARIATAGHATFESVHMGPNGPIPVEVNAARFDDGEQPRILSVARDMSDRKRLEQALMREATTDPLTGVRNRRQFFTEAEREYSRALRYRSGFGVLMLDIDLFKNVNDRYGHHAGDAVLRKFAETCVGVLRTTDIFGRLGGEEFAVVLPEAGAEEAVATAERIRRQVENMAVVHEGTAIHCTVSVGVALLGQQDVAFDSVLRRADRALYAAKANGRNRVEMAAEE